MRAKTIISFVLFAVVFTGLTLIASYCDLSISKILTKNTLPEGAYISTSVFTLFFEAMGSCPIYLVVSMVLVGHRPQENLAFGHCRNPCFHRILFDAARRFQILHGSSHGVAQ